MIEYSMDINSIYEKQNNIESGICMKQKYGKRILISILVVIVVVCGAFALYVNDYYEADTSVEDYLSGNDNVSVISTKEGLFLDGKGEEKALIFYPGAKVEYTAYLPMLMELAEEGVDCFLVKMPFHLAFFGMNKADTIMKQYDYDQWYLSGHSLGGAMAAYYASSHLDKLDGLALFGAYPTKELKKEGFLVVSIYGSEDKVLNMKKVEEGRSYMPTQYFEVCLQGGNHSQFGNYGEQKGDGIATMSREEQQEKSVEAVLKMIQEHSWPLNHY